MWHTKARIYATYTQEKGELGVAVVYVPLATRCPISKGVDHVAQRTQGLVDVARLWSSKPPGVTADAMYTTPTQSPRTSLSCAPDASVSRWRSEPAKSTSENRAWRDRWRPVLSASLASMVTVNTLWLRELSRFMAVLPTRRLSAPRSIAATASSEPSTVSSARPST